MTMFGFKKKFLDVKIRDFEPYTDNDNPIDRKNDLLDEIRPKINENKVKKDCKEKLFSLKIIYYLNKNTKITGQYEKDLDNMSKIVCDTLTDYLSALDKQNDKKTGLGLMRDDEDIHELHLVKKFVETDLEQGLDIKLYKWSDKKHSDTI